MKKKCLTLLLALGCLGGIGAAQTNSPFKIRGTLPWHNFLSGPTAWEEADYAKYLDRLQALGLNYVTFHCYTGGAERYATYVEPLIKIEYRNVVPETTFDTSLTARWGYRPLAISNFAFGTSQAFTPPAGATAFGASYAVLPKSKEEHYAAGQKLFARVIQLAHERGIQVGLGFEFGIHPPEFASIVPPESWIRGAGIPDPTHPAVIEILHRTIDNILLNYPDIDWVWLWLHEMTVYLGRPRVSGPFRDLAQKEAVHFQDATTEDALFNGIWALAYIREAYDYLSRRAPKVRLAISGWGGGTQLPGTLRGLDRALPPNIVFTCLNPNQGWAPQPDTLADIARHRQVWAIPWLEGDARLWHLQPRVNLLREHVQLAEKQKLDGVLAIHWRTEEMRANLDAFAQFAADPTNAPAVEAFYQKDSSTQYGPEAAPRIAALLAWMDKEQSLETYSPEYYPYDPSWGRLKSELRKRLEEEAKELQRLGGKTTNAAHRANVEWLLDNLRSTLLLDETSRLLEPAYVLKERYLRKEIPEAAMKTEAAQARKLLHSAPLESLFTTYARRIRSPGERGELSALNQKLWLQYQELDAFLARHAGKN